MRSMISMYRPPNLFQQYLFFYHLLSKANVRSKTSAIVRDNKISNKLKQIINFRTTKNSNWVVEGKINSLCHHYYKLSTEAKIQFLLSVAADYSVSHEKIHELANKLCNNEVNNQNQLLLKEKALKDALTPSYHWLFIRVGRLKNGVKFLVDFRSNVLDIIKQFSNDQKKIHDLVQMDRTLKDLLFLWFSVGFMNIQRVTWQTSCDILQKVSDYEAIHPMRNWTDLKKRVGPYRRCYIFTHPSMPQEPLVVLHTALCDVIPDSVKGIQEAEDRILGNTRSSQKLIEEDKTMIKAAVFYSIVSTQSGLQGIELGNYLIKEVVKLVSTEFPNINQISSLSPIPNFRLWLLDQMKKDINTVFTKSEQESIKVIFDSEKKITPIFDLFLIFRKVFSNSLWVKNNQLVSILKQPLLRSCAWYLYQEKRRNYCLNNVANFHLRNGAVMWRLNWLADTSVRGMENSCGIMVNYRYYPNETETNSIRYVEDFYIKTSESVMNYLKEAQKIYANDNIK